jgi:hypothetical protein
LLLRRRRVVIALNALQGTKAVRLHVRAILLIAYCSYLVAAAAAATRLSQHQCLVTLCWESMCSIVMMCARIASVTLHGLLVPLHKGLLLAVLQCTARTGVMRLHDWALKRD